LRTKAHANLPRHSAEIQLPRGHQWRPSGRAEVRSKGGSPKELRYCWHRPVRDHRHLSTQCECLKFSKSIVRMALGDVRSRGLPTPDPRNQGSESTRSTNGNQAMANLPVHETVELLKLDARAFDEGTPALVLDLDATFDLVAARPERFYLQRRKPFSNGRIRARRAHQFIEPI
jgi:hypothetical protein